MAIDYESHPSELIGSGQTVKKKVDVKQMKDAIPPHCFEPSYATSFGYLARDLFYCSSLVYLAYNFIPMIPNVYARAAAWGLYGFLNGLVFMGLWVLGHEMGHGAWSKSSVLNNTLGYILHTSFMTPFFAWRSTHRRHHIYANNMVKDHNYVPVYKDEYAASIIWARMGEFGAMVEEYAEDAPVVTILRVLLQQLIGFPYYLLTNITAAPTSLPAGKKPSESFLGNSHFAPSGVLFRKEEFGQMLISDIGLAAMAAALFYGGTVIGHGNMALLYLQPYLWVNHWIVAVTYLHHTHPDLPKYSNEAWSFVRGATATVDRSIGWGNSIIGRHFFHNISDFHVVHHLFSRIPFYHAEEATYAIIPLLGDEYHSDKDRAFLPSLYESFTKCRWVEEVNPEAPANERVLKYQGGARASSDASKNSKDLNKSFSTLISNLSKKSFRPHAAHAKTA